MSSLGVASYVRLQIEAGAGTLPYEAKDVYYGDQVKIPFVPTICVEAGSHSRQSNGAPRRYLKTIYTYVLVYLGKVQGTGENMFEADQLAEQLEELLNADAQMAGLVIDSFVSSIEYNYLERTNSIFRVARLTIESRMQEQLPSSF